MESADESKTTKISTVLFLCAKNPKMMVQKHEIAGRVANLVTAKKKIIIETHSVVCRKTARHQFLNTKTVRFSRQMIARAKTWSRRRVPAATATTTTSDDGGGGTARHHDRHTVCEARTVWRGGAVVAVLGFGGGGDDGGGGGGGGDEPQGCYAR